MTSTKPFEMSKRLVWDAWKRIKSNGGAHGIDKVSLEAFEQNLSGNLYKIWNRMSSGSYFPPPVRRIEIPKDNGTKRQLGIPTVGDRVAQMVAKMVMEPELEPVFSSNSFGYRPGKSAIEAVHQARTRCMQYDWVIDLDIKGFFDNIDHDLMMKAVEKHTKCGWLKLYIKRWLTTPVMLENGEVEARNIGTPQGGVISPLLANLFLHYAFDTWLTRNHQDVPFERYADDAVLHCKTRWKAKKVLEALQDRLKECKLELHPEKTKIVYCKDSNRRGAHEWVSFDFLGFCFKPRKAINKHKQVFTGFLPAISGKAKKRISTTVRKWKIQTWSGHDIEEIARALNPVISGWLNYYKHFGKSELYQMIDIFDFALVRWARKKFKKLKRSYRKSKAYISRLRQQNPILFVHWYLLKGRTIRAV
ncbi:group II intron reverse transcriptase/maturase [Vibrio mediterranei]|uniref:group II intron reverse transcriptase/maturase n=1 Tax=Vibrio mediterranei TaxID=689 RepID=UPI00148CA354|nr:group II intron reverse transcriptase/maturase [Vibrio mediterranei]NOI26849.1 group II intron reverse transcriptase/maturase [Vibrio mediterranei]